MTDNDMLMAKTAPPGWINLAVGEPGLLQMAMRQYVGEIPNISIRQRYPEPGGTPALKAELKSWTNQDSPAFNEHIVVANGAKQALLAVYWAHRKLRLFDTFSHTRNQWPSHRTLASMAGYTRFISHRPGDAAEGDRSLIVNTSPNNPDGVISKAPCLVWDAAYAHSMYGFRTREDTPAHRTAVYSAAKLFGLSGERIGWLATSDSEVARVASEYIEATTSGVSLAAQERLLAFMLQMKNRPSAAFTAYSFVKDRLITNRKRLSVLLERPMGPDVGMFAWCRTDQSTMDQLREARVMVLPGGPCGDTGYMRVNLGGDMHDFDEAMHRIGKAKA